MQEQVSAKFGEKGGRKITLARFFISRGQRFDQIAICIAHRFNHVEMIFAKGNELPSLPGIGQPSRLIEKRWPFI